MHWATKYIGIPWVFGGRDLKGFDCYGLFKYIEENDFNLSLLEIDIDTYNYKNVLLEFDQAKEFSNWKIVDSPQEGDAAVLTKSRYPNHIGVCIDSDGIKGLIHCIEHTGVVFNDFLALKRLGWGISNYYRHRSKCE